MISTLAKAFITIIFLMTSVFLGIAISEAANADNNPKYEYQSVLAQRQVVKFDIERLTEDILREQGGSVDEDGAISMTGEVQVVAASLYDERSDLAGDIQAAEQERTASRNEITEKLMKLQDIAVEVSHFTATVKAYREALGSFARKNANLQDVYQDNIRQYESLAIENLRMQIEMERLAEDARALNDAYTEAQRETQQLTEEIRAIVARNPYIDEIARGTGPVVEANVTHAGTDTGVISIDRGRQDGVRLGMRFSIYRQSEFIGKMEIILVQEQTAVGRLVVPYEGVNVQVNDTVRRSPVLTHERGR